MNDTEQKTITEALVERAVAKLGKPWCKHQKHPSKTERSMSAAWDKIKTAKAKKRKLQKKARKVAR